MAELFWGGAVIFWVAESFLTRDSEAFWAAKSFWVAESFWVELFMVADTGGGSVSSVGSIGSVGSGGNGGGNTFVRTLMDFL